jgi:hypothetical protein
MILIKIVYGATSLYNLSKFFYAAFGILFTCSLFQLYIYFRDTLSGKILWRSAHQEDILAIWRVAVDIPYV